MFHNGICTTVMAPMCDALAHCRCKTTCWVSACGALMWPDIDMIQWLRWLMVQQQRNLDQSSAWLCAQHSQPVQHNVVQTTLCKQT